MLDMNQSPQNWKDISVYGTNVSAIQHDIDLFVENHFPNFTVQAQDLDDYLWFNEFNENNNLNGKGKVSMQVYKLRPSPISGRKPIEVGRVACELALRAKTGHGDEAIYVGFPSHLVFEVRDCERLVNTDHEEVVHQIKEELSQDNARYELRIHNQATYLCLLETPKFVYQHYYPLNSMNKTHIQFMKDMAVMRLDETKLTVELKSAIKSSMSKKILYSSCGPKAYHIAAQYLNPDPRELVKMSLKACEVVVGPYARGVMRFVGDASWREKMNDRRQTQNRLRSHRVEFITAE